MRRNIKLKYKENLYFSNDNLQSNKKIHTKDGFVKADWLYYFDKANIDYYFITKLTDDYLEKLLELSQNLKSKDIVSNLNKKVT